MEVSVKIIIHRHKMLSDNDMKQLAKGVHNTLLYGELATIFCPNYQCHRWNHVLAVGDDQEVDHNDAKPKQNYNRPAGIQI